jgi:DNA-binding transcriptional LysR family regulator
MLGELNIFIRTFELGSITAAARSLRMSVASASVRLRQLEDHLGARLFNRTTRSLQATDAGQVFYKHALDVIAAVEQAERSVAEIGGAPAGFINVATTLSFGRRVLAPLVARFHRAHPHIQVRLRASDIGVDLLAEHIDLAVNTTATVDSAFAARKVADGPRVICAAPAYLDRCGRPHRPDDLADHNCLLLRFPGSRDFRWTFITAEGGLSVPVSGGFDSDDGDILLQWALLGEGLVLKPYWEVAEYLRRGQLEVVLEEWALPPADITLVFPDRDDLAPKTRLFADFLIDNIGPLVEQPCDRPGAATALVAAAPSRAA